jgi:hypothetical protein
MDTTRGLPVFFNFFKAYQIFSEASALPPGELTLNTTAFTLSSPEIFSISFIFYRN